MQITTSQTNQSLHHNSQKKDKDIFKDTPVRYLGFTNELGTAISDVCKNSRVNVTAMSYVPAFGYILADTYDKYKKGEDGNSEKPSLKMGAREFAFQCVTSVLAPTAVILGTKKAAKTVAKKIGPKLPEGIKKAGESANNFLKTNKVTGKVCSKPGMTGKIALAAVALTALPICSKPIDKAAEFAFEKFVDPLLGIKPKNEGKN